MKTLIMITLLLFSAALSLAQQFKLLFPYDEEKFNSFMEKGLVYIRMNGEEIDSYYEDALKKYWTATPYTILDEGDTSLTDETIVLHHLTSHDRTCLVQWEFLKKGKGVFITDCELYLSQRGFCPKESPGLIFQDLIIKTFNSLLEFDRDRYKGKTKADTKKMNWNTPAAYAEEVSLPQKAKYIKEKKLLLIGENINLVSMDALTSYGVESKQVSLAEYENMAESERSEYCLFYYADPSLTFQVTYIMIFDLEDNNLIFTKEYLNEKGRFSTMDLKKISEYW